MFQGSFFYWLTLHSGNNCSLCEDSSKEEDHPPARHLAGLASGGGRELIFILTGEGEETYPFNTELG